MTVVCSINEKKKIKLSHSNIENQHGLPIRLSYLFPSFFRPPGRPDLSILSSQGTPPPTAHPPPCFLFPFFPPPPGPPLFSLFSLRGPPPPPPPTLLKYQVWDREWCVGRMIGLSSQSSPGGSLICPANCVAGMATLATLAGRRLGTSNHISTPPSTVNPASAQPSSRSNCTR